MENQLYRTTYIREITLNNGDVIRYKNSNGYLKYGEFNEKLNETCNWDKFLLSLGYVPEFHGRENRKGRIWCEVDYTDKHSDRCQTKVYKDEFKSMKSYLIIRAIELKNVRMKQLVDELSAEEFILFLKDNEIRYMGCL